MAETIKTRMEEYKPGLSYCELLVMLCVWNAETEGVTGHEIKNTLRGKYQVDCNDTAVYAYTKKLKNKNYLYCEKRGIYFFFAKKSKEEYFKEYMLPIRKVWFNDNDYLMLKEIIKHVDLDDEERAAIKKLL